MAPEKGSGGGGGFLGEVGESMPLALHVFDEMAFTTCGGNVTTF